MSYSHNSSVSFESKRFDWTKRAASRQSWCLPPPLGSESTTSKRGGATAVVRPCRVKSPKRKTTMNTFDDKSEQPEPLWQTILGCLFLALMFGLALLIWAMEGAASSAPRKASSAAASGGGPVGAARQPYLSCGAV